MDRWNDLQRLLSKHLLMILRRYWFVEDTELGFNSGVEAFRTQPASGGNTEHWATSVRITLSKWATSWPLLLAGFYIYTTLKVLTYMYLQFKYDEEYLRLCQMDHTRDPILRVVHTRVRFDLNGTEYLNQKAKMDQARALLSSVGAPFAELHLICIGCCYLLTSVTMATYGAFLFLTKLKLIAPFDFYFVRLMLNEPAELERCREIVRKAVLKMKVSSRNHILYWTTRSSMVKTERGAGSKRRRNTHTATTQQQQQQQQLQQVQCKPARALYAMTKQAARQLEIQTYLWRQAELMLKHDQLIPINRTPEWLDTTSRTFVPITVGIMANFIIFDHFFILFVTYMTGHLKLESFMDVWMLVDILILVAISIVSSAFLLGLSGTMCFSQQRYLQRMAWRLKNCIRENGELFERYQTGASAGAGGRTTTTPTSTSTTTTTTSGGRSIQLSRKINKNLMVALLEFEIFSKQFEPTKETFPFLVNVITTTVTAFYVMFRLLMPYMPPWIDSLAIYFGLVAVVLADVVFIPICQIHSLGTSLYKIMGSLTAQTVELNHRLNDKSGHQAFAAHLFWVQRRLGADSDRFTDRFAAYGFMGSFKMSWLGLVKWHIIFSLLPLSAFFQANSWKALAGNRIDDPLGIFIEYPTQDQ